MSILKKRKDIILYIVFGFSTTLVNIVVYWICSHMMTLWMVFSTIVAWICSVLFAYVTNRKWVFHSNINTKIGLLKEMLSFFGMRLGTGTIDLVLMFVFTDFLEGNDMYVKIASNFVVIVLNYIVSKFLIFKVGGEEKS